jgi:prepilin-type N-terminal cleavage/methylation domain-containing protein
MKIIRVRISRHGFTLAELLIAMVITSLALGIATTIFVSAMRLRADGQRYAGHMAEASYLLRNLAHDVRSARGFQTWVEDDAETLALNLDGLVVYRATPEGVERVVGDAHTTILKSKIFSVKFDLDNPSPDAARTVLITVQWDEPKLMHPVLSLRLAPRRLSND